MRRNSSNEDSDNIDWEGEIDKFASSPCSSPPRVHYSLMTGSVEAGPSGTKVFDDFVCMGFSEKLVHRVIQEIGEENTDSILETLLTYSAMEEFTEVETEAQANICDNNIDSEEGSNISRFTDSDNFPECEEITTAGSDEDDRLSLLKEMGYNSDEALIALERCGPDTTLEEITDFICAAQTAKGDDELYPDSPPDKVRRDSHATKRKREMNKSGKDCKKKKTHKESEFGGDLIRLPKPMIGFGLHTDVGPQYERKLTEPAQNPPYFYYENVALAPKGSWDTMSRFLYDVEPEFVDSKYICASARKRGYIHNLPIVNRFPILPLPPLTIQEALPMTSKWWPSWDTRTKLNCLITSIATAKITEQIRKILEKSNSVEPPLSVQKFVRQLCRRWNLVWVGKNKVAPLEPDELEILLGYPKNHTRGGGINRTDRYKALGNSFQVDTVAFHFSVLKERFPEGVNLLSLFSGIGGAEVALHRLGIPLRNVVSVEISEVNRGIQRSWWEQTNQKGTLVDLADVQELDADRIEQFVTAFGGFDLVVGGSPCNNLSGANRYTRDGLGGEHSSLFYDYFRILDIVRELMSSIR